VKDVYVAPRDPESRYIISHPVEARVKAIGTREAWRSGGGQGG